VPGSARSGRAALDGVRPEDADRVTVNEAAQQPDPTPQLTEAGDVRWTGGLEAVLAALARDALDLLDSPDLAAVRQCADDRCTRLFLDRSRGARRRWCGMKGCGDRAKAAAYRRRRRLRACAARTRPGNEHRHARATTCDHAPAASGCRG
jgi:predicted RNA-binding Zn ribbon-like protein